jgi:long-chain acyl-CoA synthetase
MIQMLVNDPAIDTSDTSSLERLVYGAAPMPSEVLLQARKKFACRFGQGYGLTEASPLLTWLSPEAHEGEEASIAGALRGSAGRPVAGVTIRVVDPLDRELPPGQPGEIVARGANIMKGYWNQPENTAEALRGGWLHTGDIGIMDASGGLYILDRKKDMVKSGGENVFSPEVESTIGAHPAVLETAVIGVSDATWGEAVHAVVVRRPGAALSEAEVIAWCQDRMAHFKCPRSVAFLDALPKGATGKVQKTVLRQMSSPCARAASSAV